MLLLWTLCIITVCASVQCRSSWRAVSILRGGIVPEISTNGEYYEKFKLDYGTEENVRAAGRMVGVLKFGQISSLPEEDPFFKWLYEKLERGPQPPTQRYKPYYAADFGKKRDLKWGENPKIIIVNRKLTAAANGVIDPPPAGPPDVEVREVWQPWLKHRCDFVVRYIVPHRTNIIETMEGKRRFHSEVHFGKTKDGTKTATARLIFKPTLWERLQGCKDIVMKKPLDARYLFEVDLTGQQDEEKMRKDDDMFGF